MESIRGECSLPLEAELTDEMIAAAMAKADARVCVGSDRCYAFPDRLEDSRETCTLKGRCKVGGTRTVIVSRGGRESWNVWLEVRTGLVKLIARVDA
jgi:hypothetical protein